MMATGDVLSIFDHSLVSAGSRRASFASFNLSRAGLRYTYVYRMSVNLRHDHNHDDDNDKDDDVNNNSS
jgi:hypothetical protein